MENIPERKPTQTFVFLDMESTGFEKPKITEICLTAVHREELLNVSKNSAGSVGSTMEAKRETSLPRVADSITLCFNPGKPVEPYAYETSGLDNINLFGSRKRRFGDMEATLLILFLNRQDAPICMVAHNGKKFDFPLLKAELQRINLNFPCCEIRCGDTLQAFKDLDQIAVTGNGRLTNPRSAKRSRPESLPSASSDPLSAPLGPRVRTNRVARSLFSAHPTDPDGRKSVPSETTSEEERARDQNRDNPLTEPLQQTQSFEPTVLPNVFATGLMASNVSDSPSPTSGISTSRSLATKRQATPSPRKSHQSRAKCSYKLADVYEHIFGEPPRQSHQATADVNTLMAIFTSHADLLIDYFEKNSISFESVLPFYKNDGLEP